MAEPFRAILDALVEGFQVLSFEWRYVYVNPVAAAHGGKTPEELVGRRIMDVYPGIEETVLFARLRECMRDRSVLRMENEFTLLDGTRRLFELRIEPVAEGLCIHSVDVTERRRAEEATKLAKFHLERRVAERTAELEAANRELEAFAYSVAHDLRAPLRGIDGFAQLIVEDCGEALSAEGREYLARVRASAQRMAKLIDDLLALSRVTLTPVERADVDLTELARAVVAELDPPRRVTWIIAEGLRARCDPSLARVVLENLLGNAHKFTAQVAQPVVVVRAAEDGRGITIADNGAGFDMTYAKRLFTPFYRLHTEREFAGTGIGLTTVARIVRKHEGHVRAEGIVGSGATVTFSLEPVGGTVPPPALATSWLESEPPSSPRMRD